MKHGKHVKMPKGKIPPQMAKKMKKRVNSSHRTAGY